MVNTIVKRSRNTKYQRRYRKRNKLWGKGWWNRRNAVMYKAPRQIMPETYVTTLRYGDQETGVPGALGVTKFASYSSNAYDVDTVYGNHTIAGFPSFAAFYSNFRVLRMGYKLTVINDDPTPVSITVFLNPAQISSSSGSTINSIANPLAKSMLLSGSDGINRGVLKMNKSMTQIYGSKDVLYASLFVGATTSNTLAAGGTAYIEMFSEYLQTPTTGFTWQVEVALTIQFFKPIWQQSI